MSYTNNISGIFLCLILTIVFCQSTHSQEETPTELGTKSSYHNQLYFNRFFINPTFSLVRENKSYLNILHRNQYTSFEDNRQNYFLGFSNKVNDHTALGIGVYSQWSGVVQEFGFNANYATSVKLGRKSKLSFGTNLTYFNEGLDKNRITVIENDPTLSEARKESKIAIQPAITLSLGKFDFGLYAKDLLKYNQTTNEFVTNLSEKSVRASLQYTHSFNATRGLFEDARLMPLVQLGKNENNELIYVGSMVLDLPKYGWLQTNFDNEYGMSLGLGFNISKKMSLGYLLEKDILQKEADLGWNHEVSLAYTFKNDKLNINLTADSSQDQKIDQIIRNYEEQILALTEEKGDAPLTTEETNKEIMNTLAHENRMILDQLILRQDSIENARNAAFEKRFEMIVRAVRSDIKNSIKSNLKDFTPKKNTRLASTEVKNVADEIQKRRDFKELPIRQLDQANIVGANSGYYVIANVYSNKKYLNAFVKDLKEKGLKPKQFYNKENGLHYVYLADYDAKGKAKDAYASNLNGKYQKEKWIMEVANHSTIVHNSYND
ncbi:PorP/SprF family type IX secretion system membrane protein [Maribacter sp. 2308TA10-17]|uniref:PorP/SprF family type IX secretion system membrane protein n=1 Tax=Maribacter sp. 2308TA10-17 TaxID=3386276 RepID=UPI0039BC7255